MSTATTFSRQNDTGSRACTTLYWENLVLVDVLPLEFKGLYSHNLESLLRATKPSKFSRAAWEFDEIPKQKFIQIYHVVYV